MIRILHMIGTLGIGGSQAFVMNLYRAIDREKMQFDFIVDRPQDTHFIPEIEKMGGKVYYMPLLNGKNLRQVQKAWHSFFVNHPEYKVLHSHVRSYASLYLPIAKAHGVKTIIHSHNTSNAQGISSYIKAFLQYFLRFQADYYMACSYEAGKWLFGERVCRSEKFKVVKNAIQAKEFIFSETERRCVRKEIGLENQFVLGFLARVSKQKNPLFVIEVMKHLSEIKENALLLFVGDGEMLPEVKRKAMDLGLEKKIIFTGSRTDVGRMLTAMDCYILPSLWEGLGISLIEAQASGLRCVCSDAIQDEAIITDSVDRLSLSLGAQYWAEHIDALDGARIRQDCYRCVKDAGYDIEENSKFMHNFYAELHDSCF